MATVICHTEGCGNANTPIELELAFIDGDGVTRQIQSVQCGVCGQPITDIKR